MSIFKRSTGGQPQEPVKPPPVSNGGSGVVPPPATPTYSMRLPEPARTASPRANDVCGRPVQRAAPVATRTVPPPAFDPVAHIQSGLLSLARRWQEDGSSHRAIHAYVELLTRYPETPAAAAAISDLVELSESLAREGQFHAALGIYDHLEQLA